MDKGIAINTTDKFRNQHVCNKCIYVPIGKKIKINQNIWSDLTQKCTFWQ